MKQLSIWDYLQRLLLTIFVVSIFVILLMVAWAIVDALILLFIGIVGAVILRTFAKPIARYTPLNTKAAIIVVILLLLLLLALGTWLFVPEIVNQTEALITQVNQALLQLEQFLLQYDWGQDLLENLFLQVVRIFQRMD
ncbi:hypothetical protein [Coleofasciculus sp.]|uniref:hypothetical protein n=1 Tax=Coleofasciculus sp. TaxID=3100458 RepID=UPI003A1E4D1A